MNLVTGATGHIGNVLVRQLLQEKKPVRALVLPGEDTHPLQGLDIEKVEGNVLDAESLERAMHGVNTVFHLAGVISIMPGRNDWMWKVNVGGTQNVLAAVKKCGVERLVYTSSIHALKRIPEGQIVDETLPFDPHNSAGAYDSTKAAASLEVMKAARDGINAVIVCPTGVVGPHDYRRSEFGDLVLSWTRRGMGVMVDGNYDFVDVRDVAQGHIQASEKGCCGQSYILGGERVSLEWMFSVVRTVVGLPVRVLKIPLELARFVAEFMPFYYKTMRSKPKFTPYSIETVRSNSHISHAKAQRELGYNHRSLAESLTDTVRWWQERKLLPVKVQRDR